MIYSIINANHEDPELDIKVSELIYDLESKNIDIQNFVLKQLNAEDACQEVQTLVQSSDMAIYICPLDSQIAMKRIFMFLKHYQYAVHPITYLILDSKRTLSVEEVSDFVDQFEQFIQKHHSKIIDVEYFKDAKEALQ